MSVVIAVDGGAASGKSSTSRQIADRFNLLHVDTGSHYRAVTFCLLESGLDVQNRAAVGQYLQELPLDTEVSGHRALIRINHYLPHETELRSKAVNQSVSPVSAIPAVRAFLIEYQRFQVEVAARHDFRGVIVEGRDIGSVIFPNADVRLFLEADPATRAARRAREGQSDSIATRDRLDSAREVAPLRCPEGAIRVDSSYLSLDEVVAKISGIITAATGLSPVL